MKKYLLLLLIITFVIQPNKSYGESNFREEIGSERNIKSEKEDNIELIKELKIKFRNNSTEIKRVSCGIREIYLGVNKGRVYLSADEVREIKIKMTENLLLEDGIHVSINCQMGVLVKDGEAKRIFILSSGKKGHETAEGKFKIYYSYNGWWESTLYKGAMMYRPRYFYKNMAIHGMSSDLSVKSYPASHGCVRVEKATMDYLWRVIKKDEFVYIAKSISLN